MEPYPQERPEEAGGQGSSSRNSHPGCSYVSIPFKSLAKQDLGENRNPSLYSQPLSLIMWASSMINFPSLYF